MVHHGIIELSGTVTEKLKKLVKVKQGDTFDLGNGCYTLPITTAINAANPIRDYVPRFGDRSEFWLDGPGEPCQYSAGGFNGPIHGGFRARIKRIGYTADLDSCCWTGEDIVGERTCAPTDDSTCKLPLTTKCSEDINVHNSKCKDHWNNYKPSEMIEPVKRYCSNKDRTTNDFCKNLNEPFMDTIAENFCKDNPEDPFCSCISLNQKQKELKTKLEEQGQTLIPWCNLTDCATNSASYKPTYARDYNCPSQQICLQGVNIDGIGGNSALTNVDFSCNLNTSANINDSDNNDSDSGNDSDNDSDNDSTDSDSDTPDFNLYIIIGFVILILILVIFK